MNNSNQEYKKIAEIVIYLAGCAVNSQIPEREKFSGAGLEDIYKFAEFHKISALICMALESAGVKNDLFLQSKGLSFSRITRLEIDALELFDRLEHAKIWYMPLKGYIIKNYYPAFGMREMSDIDILFDSSQARKVRAIMQDMGFETKNFNSGAHDVYQKKPVSNFELHRDLFGPTAEKFYNYYHEIKRKLILKAGSNYYYEFSKEDLYIYITAHEYKHYSSGGTGLRSLIDIYLFMKKFAGELDYNYISCELDKLGLTEFEANNKSLAMNLFSGGDVNIINQEIYNYMITSGAKGLIEHRVSNKLKTRSKLKYLCERIFLSDLELRERFPFFYKHKILLPFLVIYRGFRALTVKRKSIMIELKSFMKVNKLPPQQ
ncbi:MAG: nucleotidyltransferase family protein [Synergistaceae bacterium]|nr:nucleotidyltransferase family protein [Synergistaceae bacterium]